MKELLKNSARIPRATSSDTWSTRMHVSVLMRAPGSLLMLLRDLFSARNWAWVLVLTEHVMLNFSLALTPTVVF